MNSFDITFFEFTSHSLFCVFPVPEEKLKQIIMSFKKQAKNGKISRENFVKIMANHGVMDPELSNQVFDTFDRNKNKYIFFINFLCFQSTIQFSVFDVISFLFDSLTETQFLNLE
jgi:Ca2+-binding EF-hand superfamily protein